MSSNDYQLQDIYRYSRKTYKQNRVPQDNVFENSRDDGVVDDSVENTREIGAFETVDDTRNDNYGVVSLACQYDLDPEGDLANILHKKCPVISLAQQQLIRLLEETNRFVRDRDAHCSLLNRYLCYCKEVISWENKSSCILVAFIFVGFFTGLLLGAATCGTHFGKFNNPILNCIDNYFIPDSHINIEDTFQCIT